jgi:predicted Zn-dependent protease
LTNRGDVASAIPIAQRAAQVLPENPAIIDTLGWSLLKRGQAADAVAALGKVHAAAPSNPETLYRLAVAQQAVGDAEGERESTKRARAVLRFQRRRGRESCASRFAGSTWPTAANALGLLTRS